MSFSELFLWILELVLILIKFKGTNDYVLSGKESTD